MLLKALLIACLITGHTCIMPIYHENADSNYRQSADAPKATFLRDHFESNTEPQDFVVNFQRDLTFTAASGQKVFQVKTRLGILTLVEFTVRFYEENVRITLEFKTDSGFGKKIYISSDVFGAPETEKLQDHAKTHALNLQPVTIKDIEILKEPACGEEKYIKLKVQWIVNLLTSDKSPVKIGKSEDNASSYLSPPIVMSRELLSQLNDLCCDRILWSDYIDGIEI